MFRVATALGDQEFVCSFFQTRRTQGICPKILKLVFATRVRSTKGGYVFTGEVSVNTWGEVPHRHPIILPLVTCPFRGVPQ